MGEKGTGQHLAHFNNNPDIENNKDCIRDKEGNNQYDDEVQSNYDTGTKNLYG